MKPLTGLQNEQLLTCLITTSFVSVLASSLPGDAYTGKEDHTHERILDKPYGT
jgi:hypothetical protein